MDGPPNSSMMACCSNADELLERASKEPNNTALMPYINFWKGEIAYRTNRLDEAPPYFFEYLKTPVKQGEVNPEHAKYDLGLLLSEKGKL